MTIIKVQWKHFWRSRNASRYFTNVHLYNPNQASSFGFKQTLCGKRFSTEDADTGNDLTGTPCKQCGKLTVN